MDTLESTTGLKCGTHDRKGDESSRVISGRWCHECSQRDRAVSTDPLRVPFRCRIGSGGCSAAGNCQQMLSQGLRFCWASADVTLVWTPFLSSQSQNKLFFSLQKQACKELRLSKEETQSLESLQLWLRKLQRDSSTDDEDMLDANSRAYLHSFRDNFTRYSMFLVWQFAPQML